MPAFEKLGCVGPRLRSGLAGSNDTEHAVENSALCLRRFLVEVMTDLVQLGEKARAFPGVAGGSGWLRLHEDRIAITVDEEVLDQEFVTRHFALLPKFLSRYAPKVSCLGRRGSGTCLLVHIPEHENSPVQPVLDDGGQQPLLVKLQPEIGHCVTCPTGACRIGTPRCRR